MLATAAIALAACTARPPSAKGQTAVVKASADGQQAGGHPYALLGTQIWDVPDTVSHRTYQIYVSLPADYSQQSQRRYPVLYVTDADYAFPVVRSIIRRLNGDGARVKDVILVGLSYAKGEDGMASRRRDYTPTAEGVADAPRNAVFGGGATYASYLRNQVFPFVAAKYRTDEANRVFLGHSYGGLFGAQVLLSNPAMFRSYILSSPSLWYGEHAMSQLEQAYAASHRDLPASVFLYVGAYEEARLGNSKFHNRYNMVSDTKTFMELLNRRRYPSLHLELEILNDEDHLSIAPRGATHGLERVLAADAKGEAKPS